MVLLQVSAVLVLAAAGMLAARGLERFSRGWIAGYAVPLAGVVLLILGRRMPGWEFLWPFSWITRTAVTYLMMALLVPMLCVTLLPRLRTRGQRVAIVALMVVMTGYYGLLPILAPWAARGYLPGLPTHIDALGVCLQTHDYTCGPAAAVTALYRLGVRAEEGRLGVAAETGPMVGTDGRNLARAINELYGGEGVRAEYRWLGRGVAGLGALAGKLPVVVSTRYAAVSGHFIAVLEVGPEDLIVGDPLSGRRRISREEFLQDWDGAGVLVERVPSP